MVFSSFLFLFYFLPAALLLYYLLPRRAKNLLLTLVSYVFYGWANPLFVVLMFVSTLIDYICGIILASQWGEALKKPVPLLPKDQPRSRWQKIALVTSLTSNLTLLGFFKYFNFATNSFDALMTWIGFPGLKLDFAFNIVLPLGISFYTFQSMSYAIDVYRGDAKAIRNFTDYACYVAMFPQLVAGPIIRFSDVADQLLNREHTLEKLARGITFFCIGMAKKIILANPCGKVADTVFNATSATTIDSWYGVVAYAFQIYFDFSAYSDMAIGLGLMFGFIFAKNFDSPYKAESITDFWHRWHISLSTWLRDYLYIPLGGNRYGVHRTYFNLAIVMLLGGLWHGAAWNFVIWGGIHGCLLAYERAIGKSPIYAAIPHRLRILCTFIIVLFSWVFFRADTLPRAIDYCSTMLGLTTPDLNAQLLSGIIYKPYYIFIMAVCAVITWTCPQAWEWTRIVTWRKALICVLLLLASIVLLTIQAYNPFIYFIF